MTRRQKADVLLSMLPVPFLFCSGVEGILLTSVMCFFGNSVLFQLQEESFPEMKIPLSWGEILSFCDNESEDDEIVLISECPSSSLKTISKLTFSSSLCLSLIVLFPLIVEIRLDKLSVLFVFEFPTEWM